MAAEPEQLGAWTRAIPVKTREAQDLAPALFDWLWRTRRLRDAHCVYHEFAWSGRRVDIVTLNLQRHATAFELKKGRLGRGLEQAIYNRAAFDRTYLVTDAMPRESSLRLAAEHGVGIVAIQGGQARLCLASPLDPPKGATRERLLRGLKAKPHIALPA